MRFRSTKVDGFQIYAVSGINTISFAIEASENARTGLLGFAVEREDPTENQKFYLPGFKVFPSVIPQPDETTRVSTFEHPVQSFTTDDFTAKSDREYTYYFHPLRGKPLNLDRSAKAIAITVKTEKLFSNLAHDVFFNRGIASSQAYSRRFGNQRPDALPPAKRQEALDWLSRDLDEAILKFIRQAAKGDTLLGCFYEFRYKPVAQALKDALDRGVDVKLVIDAKENAGNFPRDENIAMVNDTGLDTVVTLREARASAIAHNKFMVLLKGKTKKPAETWTGSTNISQGGIHGQTNVGHWVRDEATAAAFKAYWDLLQTDPGAAAGDERSEAMKKNAEFKKKVVALAKEPKSLKDIPKGITTVFSPRSSIDVLNLYVDLLDNATTSGNITLAFGVNKAFRENLTDHTPKSPILFMLLEKKDEANPKSTAPFVALNAANNIYEAWGSFLDEPVYQWTREINNRILQLNTHVSYVHSKFLLRDPLGDDPIVVTGSANFSDASTKENDENMIIVRGDTRVADIYFTEFNRLFNHYYFRSVVESTREHGHDHAADSLFLKETDKEWLRNYAPGKLKQKRVDLYAAMKGFQ